MYLRQASIAASLAFSITIAAPASAQVAYTDEGAFSAATSGTTTYVFPATFNGSYLGTSYTLEPADFSGEALYGLADAYGPTPYLAALTDNGTPLSVTTSEPAIGFFFGSYFGAQTITYDAGGVIGIAKPFFDVLRVPYRSALKSVAL